MSHVITWPAPMGEPASPDYTVSVDETPVFVYRARVRAEILQNEGLWTHHPDPAGENASFALFDMTAPVTVTIQPARPFRKAALLPVGAGIVPENSDGTVRFTLAQPRHLTLVLDDCDTQPLHLFISLPETNAPQPDDQDVLYFGPGVHELTTLRVQSGQTVYLAGGAIVRAVLASQEQGEYSEQWKVSFYSGIVFEAKRCRASLHPRSRHPGRCAGAPSRTQPYRPAACAAGATGRDHFARRAELECADRHIGRHRSRESASNQRAAEQ